MVNKISVVYSGIYDRQLALIAGLEKDAEYFHKRKKKTQDFIKEISFFDFLSEILEKYCRALNLREIPQVTFYLLPNFHVSGTFAAFSDPPTISLEKKKENGFEAMAKERILTLFCHELAHLVSHQSKKRIAKFSKLKPIVKNHVIVYALMKECLPEELFQEEKKMAMRRESYYKAMNIVEKVGHNNILEQLR